MKKEDLLKKFNSLKKLSKKQYILLGTGVALVSVLAVGGYFIAKNVNKDGWKDNGKGESVLVQKNEVLTGWQDVNGDRMFFDDKGVFVVGWQEIEGKKYYFDEKGIMTVGLYEVEDKVYLFNDDGTLFTGKKTIGGTEYPFGDDGALIVEEGSKVALENNEDLTKSLVITNSKNEVVKTEVPKELVQEKNNENVKGDVVVNKPSTGGSSNSGSSNSGSTGTSKPSKPSTGGSSSGSGSSNTTPPVAEKPVTPPVVEKPSEPEKPVTPPVQPPVEPEKPVTPPVETEKPVEPEKPSFTFPMSANEILNYAVSLGNSTYAPSKGLVRDTSMNTSNSGWSMPIQMVKTDSAWTKDRILGDIQSYWNSSMSMSYNEGDAWNIQVVDTGNMIEVYFLY